MPSTILVLPAQLQAAWDEIFQWPPSHGRALLTLQGLGQDLLAEILQAASPQHVIMLQMPNARRNLPPEPFWVLPGPPSALQQAQQPRIVQLPALAQPAQDGACFLQHVAQSHLH